MIKVMIVDDELVFRKVISKILSSGEMDTTVIGCYDNAVSALEAMVEDVPDILITDVKMPVVSGIELIGRAKEMYPFIQCVILSGYDEFSLAQAAMMEGVRHYLLKPCNEEKIKKAIKDCMRQAQKEKKALLQDEKYRENAVDRLVAELQELLTDDKTISTADLANIIETYDKPLLREAIIMLVLKFWSEGDKKKAISTITQIFEEKNLNENITDILNELRKSVCADKNFIDKVISYTEENYHMSNLTLRFVAENIVFMNVQYVGKQFNKKIGMKYSDFLLKTRIDAAKKMLNEKTNIKMYEVAESVGLGKNVQYFYQLFKEYTGLTPKEYREHYKKESFFRI